MQSAISNGLYGLSMNPTFSCSSGNCTWPDITTLGVCGSCVNATQQTKRKDCDAESVLGMNICSFTTPGGFEVSAASGTGPKGDYWTTFNSSASNVYSENQNITNIARFGYLKATGRPTEMFGMPHLEFSECEIYFCARRYSGFRIRDGNVETGTYLSAPLHYSSYPANVWFVDDAPVIELQAPDSWSGNKSFIINVIDMESIADLLENLFSTDLMLQTVYDHLTVDFGIANTFYKADNLSQTIDNIATSMTNTIRQSQSSTQVVGQAFRDETFIRVRWSWLILPATLVSLTALILQATIIINRRYKAMLWKSSTLPLLYHGLDPPVDVPVEKLSQVEVMTAAITAQLRTTEGNNYRFVHS